VKGFSRRDAENAEKDGDVLAEANNVGGDSSPRGDGGLGGAK
jgi:hypothetical protein